MSSAAKRALMKAMRERSFERVYYFAGEDDFRKEGMIRELVSTVLDPSTREFNLGIVRGEEVTTEALETALATPPMFADRRMIVIRDVHALKKAPRAMLDRYLENPAPDAVLLMVDPASERPDVAMTKAAFTVDFQKLDAAEVPAWIADYARKTLGVEVTEEACRTLHAAVGTDLAALASELDKLSSYTGGAPITETAVGEVVGVRRGETMGDLLDAVAERNATRALALLPVVLAEPRTNAVTMIMALATQTAAIAWGRAARDRGIPAAGIERGFYTLLKEGRAFPGRTWKDAVTTWSRAVPRWTADQLDAALRELLAADVAAKDARVSSEEQLLQSLVLSLCVPATRSGREKAA